INANSNAAALAVGEKGADLVLEDHRTQFGSDPGYEQSWNLPRQQIHDSFANRIQVKSSYDYIVVGAGSAGSIVACRLAHEKGNRVLLLEAGEGQDSVMTDFPGMFNYNLQNPSRIWQYVNEEQPEVGQAFINRQTPEAKGKVLGGSSAVNFMVYNRGNRKYYDSIARDFGANGWSFEQLLPYFKKSENNTDPNVDPRYHGRSGPVGVSTSSEIDPTLSRWQKALTEQGFPIVDPNGPTQYGTSIMQSTIRDGMRQSTANAYLEFSNICPDINILTGAFVTKVLISDQMNSAKAYGVEFTKGNRNYRKIANKEIIVSAGTNGSPHLLMLSGIGPREHLHSFGIEPVWADLPVGQNLQNHVAVVIPMLIKNSSYVLPAPQLSVQQMYQALFEYTGPLAQMPALYLQFNSSVNSDWTYPDIIIHVDVVNQWGLGFTNGIQMGVRLNEWTQYYQHLLYNNYLDVIAVISRPKSVGNVRLRSSDPQVLPIIEENFLKHPDDKQALLDAISYAYYVVEETSVSKYVYVNPQPVPGCSYCSSGPVWQCTSYHICIIKQVGRSFRHPVGTCRMGGQHRTDVVVDERLRVRGVSSLRVIDTSVFPTVINANTNAAALAVGEKGADLVLEDHRTQFGSDPGYEQSWNLPSLLCVTVLTAPTGDISAVDLRVEYLRNPIAVDIPQPRLQWTLKATDPTKRDLSQKAYQILVATDPESLDKDIGNLWDSKKVVSDRTTHIKYGGTPLKSGQRAYWKVNVWDQNDQVQLGASGGSNFWDKGLDVNDWTAQYIGAPVGTQHTALQNISDIDLKLTRL
ncbi:unnamed protein product, partial [Oppiella nova]